MKKDYVRMGNTAANTTTTKAPWSDTHRQSTWSRVAWTGPDGAIEPITICGIGGLVVLVSLGLTHARTHAVT